MGLDMYAYRRIRTSTLLGATNDDASASMRCDEEVANGGDEVTSIELQEHYWRKANQIHAWFVEHVQQGKDDCQEYEIPIEKLYDLRDRCERVLKASTLVSGEVVNGEQFEDGAWVPVRVPGKVIKNPTVAKQLLSTSSGFFFGHYDYDEGYYYDVASTFAWVRDLIERQERGALGTLFYKSDW